MRATVAELVTCWLTVGGVCVGPELPQQAAMHVAVTSNRFTPNTSASKGPTSSSPGPGQSPSRSHQPDSVQPPRSYLVERLSGSWLLNWSLCSLSRTRQPSAVNHSPALTEDNEPRTVTGSRCPRTFTRSTENPLSSLKNVTLSTSPAISSVGLGVVARKHSS